MEKDINSYSKIKVVPRLVRGRGNVERKEQRAGGLEDQEREINDEGVNEEHDCDGRLQLDKTLNLVATR